MRKSQAGYTMVEALAYIALYGAIGSTVLVGAGVVTSEMRSRKDLATLTTLEKEIRTIGLVLDNYDVTVTDTTIVSGAASLQDFLCNNNISWCDSLPSGNSMTIYDPGTLEFNEDCKIAYSFAIKVSDLSGFECTKYWDYPWSPSVIMKQTGVDHNVDVNVCAIKEDMSADICSGGKDFIVYYR